MFKKDLIFRNFDLYLDGVKELLLPPMNFNLPITEEIMPASAYVPPPDKQTAHHPDHWVDAHFSTSDGIRVGRVISMPKKPTFRMLLFCGFKSPAKDYDHPHLDHLTKNGALVELIPMPDPAVNVFSHEDNKRVLRETLTQVHAYSDLPTVLATHSMNGLALIDSLRDPDFLDLLDAHKITKLIFLAPYIGSKHLTSAWKPAFYDIYARIFAKYRVGEAPLDHLEKGFIKEVDKAEQTIPKNLLHKHARLAVQESLKIMEEIKAHPMPFSQRVHALDITCIAGDMDSVSYKEFVKEAADMIGALYITVESGHCPLTESKVAADYLLEKLREIKDPKIKRIVKDLRRMIWRNFTLEPRTDHALG